MARDISRAIFFMHKVHKEPEALLRLPALLLCRNSAADFIVYSALERFTRTLRST